MIRFSWLQFRVQAVVAGGGLAIIAVVLAVTGPNLVHLYDTTVANCSARTVTARRPPPLDSTPMTAIQDFLALRYRW